MYLFVADHVARRDKRRLAFGVVLILIWAPFGDEGTVAAQPSAGAPDQDADAVGFVDADAVGFSDTDTDTDTDTDAVGFGDADALGFGAGGSVGADATEPPVLASLNDASPWTTGLDVRTVAGLWLERLASQPLATAKGTLHGTTRWKDGPWTVAVGVHAEYDGALRVQPSAYNRGTVQAYEKRLYLHETYLAYRQPHFEFSLGRRVLSWGVGELLSPLDVAAPKDLREPGLAELADLRLPWLATELGAFWGYHRLQIAWVHEADFGFRSAPDGLFSLVPAVAAAVPGLSLPPVARSVDYHFAHQERRFELENQQVFVRWSYQGPIADAALYFASALDQQGAFADVQGTLQLAAVPANAQTMSFPTPELTELSIELAHPRYELWGASVARSQGSFMLRGEARALNRIAYNVVREEALAVERFTVLGGMLSLSYTGLADLTLTTELAKDWLLRGEGEPLMPVTQPSLALRARQTLDRERWTVELLAVRYGALKSYGGFVRAEVAYDAGDGLSFGLGAIAYVPSSRLGPFSGLDTHERAYCKFGKSF